MTIPEQLARHYVNGAKERQCSEAMRYLKQCRRPELAEAVQYARTRLCVARMDLTDYGRQAAALIARAEKAEAEAAQLAAELAKERAAHQLISDALTEVAGFIAKLSDKKKAAANKKNLTPNPMNSACPVPHAPLPRA